MTNGGWFSNIMGQVERAVADGRLAAGGVRFAAPRSGGNEIRNLGQAGGIPPGRPQPNEPGGNNFPPDLAFLADHGFPPDLLAQIAAIAQSKGLCASEVLIARGLVSSSRYRALAARQSGAEHSATVPDIWMPARLRTGAPEVISETPMLLEREGRKRVYVPLDGKRAGKLLAFSGNGRRLLRPFVMVPPAELRLAHLRRNAGAYTLRAAHFLDQAASDLSAKNRTTPAQACLLALVSASVAALTISAPMLTAISLGLASTLYFLAALFLRVYLYAQIGGLPSWAALTAGRSTLEPEDLPVYSILVPLYKEPGQVRELVRSLERLDWPASRKEVFLVCEADDAETIAAVRRSGMPEGFFFVPCPPSLPRTKPKALNFALPLVRGEFTVVYDAEDRPHPLQLKEAFAKFRQMNKGYACLQAPLAIRNGSASWLSGMFEMEYDVLFRGLLPALEKVGGPIPLGGTSNHFRTEALRASGGWDAWNVTEDADLGVRLARLGMRCGTINLPTFEEAPSKLPVWIRQRTRWLKGWIQTVLVHMRNPLRLYRELGPWSFTIFQLLLTSVVVSALIHPFVLAHMAIAMGRLFAGHSVSQVEAAYLGVEAFSLAASYATYGILAVNLARREGKRITIARLLSLPAYWILMSVAAWRAAWQFLMDPFKWEKTEHGLANFPGIANIETNLTAIAE